MSEPIEDDDDLTDEDWEAEACTCDFDEPENCPVHYPIDDGSEDDDDCMDCGVCCD
jgi:hypothetical protein